MTRMSQQDQGLAAMAHAAQRSILHRSARHPLHPTATAEELRRKFCVPLPEGPRDGVAVLDDLADAAQDGLVGNTDGSFFAWVMGGSSTVGVAADWMTSAWGQNAAIYQTAPAAAIAEEAVSAWLLDILDLPREASVGFVTGATMAAFVSLAAARTAVLDRAGHNFERDGLQGAPTIKVFLSDDAHITNFSALRYIGLGEANIIRLPSDNQGRMITSHLADALDAHLGPKIIIAQAGHINSGAFEDFAAISHLSRQHDAWLHVDGAFGLWARAAPSRAHLVAGVDLADSWSVDGHKWLQIPYDSGFAIVKERAAHQRAMDISAAYLNSDPEDGRNPTQFNPELSRRARGFAAWASFQSLGRRGISDLIETHCACAARLGDKLRSLNGLEVVNDIALNQVIVADAINPGSGRIGVLGELLNESGEVFVRPAQWRDREVLRLSIISGASTREHAECLYQEIARAWAKANR